ncbi:hypothetical protein SPX_05470 [Sporomusa paucivorans]|uniref:EAL domain-containing protein n=1 Tax=Sporomusa sphaeroides TaxID=47679 RepID=UPI0031591101
MFFSIRWQLTLIICSLILLAMVSTLAISYSLVSEDYERKMHHNNSVMAESLAANIAQFMQNAYNVNQMLAEYSGLEKLDIAKQRELLVDITWEQPFFQVLAVTQLNGDQLARSKGPPTNRFERWWFKKFMAERKPYISQTYYSISSESPITTIVHGIYNEGKLAGLLMADIEVRKIQQMVENYNSGEGSYAYLLDGDGAVIAHPDRRQVAELYNYRTMKKKVLLRDADGKVLRDDKNNEITEEISFEGTASLQAIVAEVMAGKVGVGEYTALDGKEYICAYRTISLPGASDPWSLIVVQKKSAVMAFMSYVTVKTTLVGILVIALSALLTIWFSRKITDPLLDIVNATNRIKEGDLAVRLTTNSSNEIAILAANFNQMVAELRQHRERLEELVEARTAQLGAANQEMTAMNEELTAVNETLEDTNYRLLDENEARRKTENKLLLRERQYRAITGLLTQPVEEDETEDILRVILHNAVQLLGGMVGYIGLFDAEGKHFYIHHIIGIDTPLIREPQPAQTGMKGHVYNTGEIFYIEDYRKYPERVEHCCLSDLISSVIMVPLKQAGKVKGVLTISWQQVIQPISEEDLAGLRQFGDLASIALERYLVQKDIRQLAYHDILTGLPNRASLTHYLEAELEKARAGESAGVILFIDIDDLKSVNDNFGHSFGDTVIVSASRHIVAAVGEKAFVSRISGDEFFVVVPGINSRDRAVQIADKTVGELCKEYEVALEKLHLSASVGLVVYPEDGVMAEELMKKADSAMYAAKQAGRNCWRFYKSSMLKAAYEKMMLTNRLRRGLERGEFYLYYQPQFAAADRRIVGFEALLRWNSSDYGFISPARFIPLAEQSGLILPIGQWVLQEACRFARRLADSGQEHIQVAMNISPRQLMSEDFVACVRTSIEAAGIKPGQIEIEITESVFIESMEDSVHKLCQLRDIGVNLALDDFGIGYSSLTYLRSLPVGILKIDKSFIDKISSDEVQLQVVGSIIDLGHTLGMSVVAEGVETEEQLAILTKAGCDHIQGYVFSKPLAEEAAMSLLKQ